MQYFHNIEHNNIVLKSVKCGVCQCWERVLQVCVYDKSNGLFKNWTFCMNFNVVFDIQRRMKRSDNIYRKKWAKIEENLRFSDDLWEISGWSKEIFRILNEELDWTRK